MDAKNQLDIKQLDKKTNWTQKTNFINETIVNIKNVTVLILSYNNQSYHCFNNTNNSILNLQNKSYPKKHNIANQTKNISLNYIENIIASDVDDQKSNISKTECNNDKFSLREILIILGFSIVVLLFIIYNLVDFFELKKDDCCKTNRPERQHEMDRPFEDMIQMVAFDDDGNFMFGRRHAGVQTETFPESRYRYLNKYILNKKKIFISLLASKIQVFHKL